jgi:hypothetical protein
MHDDLSPAGGGARPPESLSTRPARPIEDADVAAYQCNGYGADCVEVDAAVDDRGIWYAACPEPTDYRPLLVVDWSR